MTKNHQFYDFSPKKSKNLASLRVLFRQNLDFLAFVFSRAFCRKSPKTKKNFPSF